MSNYETLLLEKYGFTMTRTEAAEAIKVSLPTIDRMIKDKTIKSTKKGHAVSILPKTIAEYLGAE